MSDEQKIASDDERAAELLTDAVLLLHAGERSQALKRVTTATQLLKETTNSELFAQMAAQTHALDAQRHMAAQQSRQMAQNIDHSILGGLGVSAGTLSPNSLSDQKKKSMLGGWLDKL